MFPLQVVATDPTTVTLIEALLPTVLTLATAAIGTIVTAVGYQLRKLVAAQANGEHADFLAKVAEIAVQAIEQTYAAANGDEKKAAAIAAAERALEARGVKVDLDIIDDAIEAAVLREFNYPQAVTPADPPTETVVEMAPGGTGEGPDVA